MVQFEPGSTHSAKVVMTNPTSNGFDYLAVLFMGINQVAKAQASFHLNAGESKEISFSVTMPATIGEYPVYLSVFSGTALLAHYQSPENVNIVAPAFAECSITPLVDFWIGHEIIVGCYYHRVWFGAIVTNNGSVAATHTVEYYNSFGGYFEPGTVQVTLAPGESVALKFGHYDMDFQRGPSDAHFTIIGDWVGNNEAVGHLVNGNVTIGTLISETHREW